MLFTLLASFTSTVNTYLYLYEFISSVQIQTYHRDVSNVGTNGGSVIGNRAK